LYSNDERFVIGGSKTVVQSDSDQITVVSAGITLHESIKASKILGEQGINIRVIDLYSIKPLDKVALQKASDETQAIITVEDHLAQGGIYEAVCGSGIISVPVHCLAVKKMSCSGTPAELLAYMEIDADAIVSKVKEILGR
jgi:transketolase